MKTLTLLLCLFLIGCEKRVADPEIEKVREWLLSADGQEKVANRLADKRKITLDQLVSCESWVIKRVGQDDVTTQKASPLVPFVLLGEEKKGDRTWGGVCVEVDGQRILASGFFPLTAGELESLGDPVSLEKVDRLFMARR